MPRPVSQTGYVAWKVFHELPDSVESLSAFYCRWNRTHDTIFAPAVARRYLSAATVTMVSATALEAARNWLALIPLRLRDSAIRRVFLAVTNTQPASASTVLGKQ